MRYILLLLMTVLAFATSLAGAPTDPAQLRNVLHQLGVDSSPAALDAAPVAGFFEVTRGTQVLYVSTDGSMIIDGDILSVTSETNLTERRRTALRREILERNRSDDRFVVPATAPVQARIVVFTDTNCAYCRLLHRRHEEILRQGIEIEYMFYPRKGPSGDSWTQAVSVWCARDRVAALDAALSGTNIPAADCPNPVAAHYDLALQLELRGTPAIIMPDGAVHYGMTDVADVVEAVRHSRHATGQSRIATLSPPG